MEGRLIVGIIKEDRLIMDLILVLSRLGYLEGEEQSPSPDLSTYQTMVDTWRHSSLPAPTEAVMLADWEVYLVETATTENEQGRLSAIYELFPQIMPTLVVLEQAKADRDVDGKTLTSNMEEAVNVYSRIIGDI